MNKEIIKCDLLSEQYYSFTHESGLQILLYPMKGFSSAYALFGTKYGSVDTTFKTQNEDFVTVPAGIAHFLEHKLFESEDGDAFTLFSKTGASANAYTSFDKTCYLFSTTDNFEESLEALVTFVQNPYFTKETVDKEQGIIGQEIKMYDDNADWCVFVNLLNALYHNHPIRISIPGTVESIAQIDKDLLYRCYHAFYNLNNMVISIAGNFDMDKAIKIIEKNLKSSEKVIVTTTVPREPREAKQKEIIQKLQVSMPLFQIGYKEAPVAEEKELEQQIKYELILNVIAGKSSPLYKEMYNEGLINSTFGKEVFGIRGYLSNIFSGEARDPYAVMNRIHEEILKYQEKEIDETSFIRVKKSMYGAAIMNFNDVEEVANDMISAYFSKNSIYDTISIIAKLTCEEINDLLRKSFSEDTRAISIIQPIE